MATAAAVGFTIAYCTVFVARPPLPLRAAFRNAVDWGFNKFSVEPPRTVVRHGTYLALTGIVIPWSVMALLRRGRLANIGFRRPNRFGWRMSMLGFLISLPFLLWMTGGARFAGQYPSELERFGLATFILYYLVNMLSEHFLLHGVVLGVCRRGCRWPATPPVLPVTAPGIRGFLQWLGLAQPAGNAPVLRRFRHWIGLPEACVLPILVSAALFALVHIGKDPRELVLSVPGGLAVAYLAYRSNSWLTTFVLHAATAGTALLMLLTLR